MRYGKREMKRNMEAGASLWHAPVEREDINAWM